MLTPAQSDKVALSEQYSMGTSTLKYEQSALQAPQIIEKPIVPPKTKPVNNRNERSLNTQDVRSSSKAALKVRPQSSARRIHLG
jgi:hypothetical protein